MAYGAFRSDTSVNAGFKTTTLTGGMSLATPTYTVAGYFLLEAIPTAPLAVWQLNRTGPDWGDEVYGYDTFTTSSSLATGIGGDFNEIITGPVTLANVWYFFAASFVSTTAFLYLKPVGVPACTVGSSTARSTFTPASIYMGADWNGAYTAAARFCGYKLWAGVTLRQDEIEAESEAGPNNIIRWANLVGWWDFSNGTDIFDRSPSNNVLTNVGTGAGTTSILGPPIAPTPYATPQLFIQVPAAAPTLVPTSFPDRVLGRGTHASLLFPFTGPIPTPAVPAAPYEGYWNYPERLPGPLWNRQLFESITRPLAPERTSPYFRNDYPDRMPQPQPVAFQQYAAAIPMRPERTSPLSAQMFPDRVPGPQQPAQMPVAALPMRPERTSPLAAQTYPDTVPGPRQPQHMHVAAMSLPLERTLPMAAQWYPDRVPGPQQPLYMTSAAIPLAPERKSPLAAQWYPDTVPGARPPQYLYVAAINEVPERISPLSAQWYPDRVPGAQQPQHMPVSASNILPIVATPAPIEGYTSYPDRVPGPQPTPAFVFWTEVSPKPITTAAAPYEGYASYPDRFPAVPPQYLYATELPPLPLTQPPSAYKSYPDAVPGPRAPQYLTTAALPLVPERKAPLAAQWFPDTVLRAPPVAQQQDQAARPMRPERTSPLASTSYPDRVDGLKYPTTEQPFATVVGRPEVKAPDDWSTSYPDRVLRATLPTSAQLFESHPASPPKPAPTVPFAAVADVPRGVSFWATLQFYSWLDSPTAPIVVGYPVYVSLAVDPYTQLSIFIESYTELTIALDAFTVLHLEAQVVPNESESETLVSVTVRAPQALGGALIDPTSIIATATAPDGTITLPPVIRQSQGVYFAVMTTSAQGIGTMAFHGLNGIWPYYRDVQFYCLVPALPQPPWNPPGP